MSEARQRLPGDLESLPPGPELATLLASVDRRLLSEKDRVRLAQARNRQVSHEQAELYADLYAVSWDETPDEGCRHSQQGSRYPWSEIELACALRWTRLAAGSRLEQARQLIEDLPAVYQALTCGTIDVPKVLVFGDVLGRLDIPTARQIVDRVIDKAPQWTTGQLRARLRRLALAADPAAAADRARAEVIDRRVRVFLGDNQLAGIGGYDLPPQRVAAGWERLTAIARAARAGGDGRRMDQLRADAMLDLLVGDGAAVGGPVSCGDLGSPEMPPDGQDERDRSWPTEPADPTLLDDVPQPAPPAAVPPAAVPPATVPPVTAPPATALADRGGGGAPLPEPPDEARAARVGDGQHEDLREFWMAGFGQLPAARPAGVRPDSGVLPGPRRGTVDLQLPLSTLMGLDELPGELSGFGPLLADIARQTIAQNPDLRWRFSVYTDAGTLLAHGITHTRPQTSRAGPPPDGQRRTGRHPTAQVAAHVRARNRTCFGPGCRHPSTGCELDHTTAWSDGGESDPGNLGPGCKAHHLFKHAAGCHLEQFTPGVFGWTTPRGMQYVTHPDPPLYEVDGEWGRPAAEKLTAGAG